MILSSVNRWLAGRMDGAVVPATESPIGERGLRVKEGLRVETLEMGLE